MHHNAPCSNSELGRWALVGIAPAVYIIGKERPAPRPARGPCVRGALQMPWIDVDRGSASLALGPSSLPARAR